jgi:hypothetical protein
MSYVKLKIKQTNGATIFQPKIKQKKKASLPAIATT